MTCGCNDQLAALQCKTIKKNGKLKKQSNNHNKSEVRALGIKIGRKTVL